MFRQPKKKSLTELEIDRLLLALKNQQPDSAEYAKIMIQLKELTNVHKAVKPETVSPDTKVMAAVNLTGILMILKHEHVNVIASKAITFIPKLK